MNQATKCIEPATQLPCTTPPGLHKPWTWIQPRGDQELLARLQDGFLLAVHERERENLCSVAHARIKALLEDRAKLIAALSQFGNTRLTVGNELHREFVSCLDNAFALLRELGEAS